VIEKGGRFLSQMDDGTWIILDERRSMEMSFKKLVVDPNTALARVVEAMRFLYADARYSNRVLQISNSMKQHALDHLQQIERKLYPKDTIYKMVLNRKRSSSPKLQFLTNKLRSYHSVRDATWKRDCKLRTISQDNLTVEPYVLGELVEANYLNEGRWFHGLVSSILEDGHIEITYLDDDTEIVNLERVRKFRPIAAGTTVQTYVRNCKECPLQWRYGIVHRVYPDNMFDIIVDDEPMNRIPLARIVK
jgi:hypothetical protein